MCCDRIMDRGKVHVNKQLPGVRPPESPLTFWRFSLQPWRQGSRPVWQKPNVVFFRGIESKPQPERQGMPSLSANSPQSRFQLCSKRQFWFQLWAINSATLCASRSPLQYLTTLIFKPPAAHNNFPGILFQLSGKDISAKDKYFL